MAKLSRSNLIPNEVYTYTILDSFSRMEQCFNDTGYVWDGKLTTSHLQNKIERFITEQGLLDWFTTDRAIISRRPRWKARFTNALIQLVILGCLEANEDGYTRTEKGEASLEGISLHVNATAKQCYIVGFGEHIENPYDPQRLDDTLVPDILKVIPLDIQETYL